MNYFISGCVFTAKFPELSRKIREYVTARGDMTVLRCCTPNWKVQIYEDKMPEGELREEWKALPHTAAFAPGDETWSLCFNCSNIIEESHPVVKVHSLWELIDQDESFPLPDHSGMKVTLQDCWRARERSEVQAAVRSLLRKMNIEFVEAEKNHEETDFCGSSLYRPQVARNALLAPKHYVQGAEGKFLPHTEEEQIQLMKEYCSHYQTETVVCYCHYCLEGLLQGGADGRHIAQLIFGE